MIFTPNIAATSARCGQVSRPPPIIRPAPPWPRHDKLLMHTSHATITANKNIFIADFALLPQPFKLFFGAGKLPLANPNSQIGSHYRDLHFKSTYDHRCGRHRCQQNPSSGSNSTPVSTIFQQDGGQTPLITPPPCSLFSRLSIPTSNNPCLTLSDLFALIRIHLPDPIYPTVS